MHIDLEALSTFSAFGFAVLSVYLLAFLLARSSGQREGLSDRQTDVDLKRMGAGYTIGAFRQGCLLLGGGLACLILLTTQNVVFALPPALAGILLPLLYPGWVRRSYFTRFETDFAECLDIWTRCLQSGLSFQQAVDTASRDLVGPAATEMDALRSEISFGDVDSALWRLYERVPLDDVRYTVMGVITCRQTGGKMSEVMANIAESIHERQAQRDRILSITSMGRTEAYVMAAMPFAIGFIMYMLEPASVSLLFSTAIGVIGTLVALLWESIGLAIIWKIVDIKA